MNARGLETLDHIKKTRLDLSNIEVDGACDVTNPLCRKKKGLLMSLVYKRVKDLEKTDQTLGIMRK